MPRRPKEVTYAFGVTRITCLIAVQVQTLASDDDSFRRSSVLSATSPSCRAAPSCPCQTTMVSQASGRSASSTAHARAHSGTKRNELTIRGPKNIYITNTNGDNNVVTNHDDSQSVFTTSQNSSGNPTYFFSGGESFVNYNGSLIPISRAPPGSFVGQIINGLVSEKG
ncbi:hypothetical protein WG66_009746 [Moniliophthora roreri]|nr:hypothetical protein WG66_009746 [Moniliophthora roreri]